MKNWNWICGKYMAGRELQKRVGGRKPEETLRRLEAGVAGMSQEDTKRLLGFTHTLERLAIELDELQQDRDPGDWERLGGGAQRKGHFTA